MTIRNKKICWSCLVVLVMSLLFMYMLTSCRGSNYDELKDIPEIVYGGDGKRDMITRSKLGYHFNYQRGRNSERIQIPTNVNMFLLDEKYREVDYTWFRKFNNWFKDMLYKNNMQALGGNGETADCDNYAMLYKSLMSAAAYKAGEKTEPAVLLMLVNQQQPFGGIPAGGSHLCIMVMTSRGWFVVEPQTGQFDEMRNYPNQSTVRLLMI